jgi:hypothetical protein
LQNFAEVTGLAISILVKPKKLMDQWLASKPKKLVDQ